MGDVWLAMLFGPFPQTCQCKLFDINVGLHRSDAMETHTVVSYAAVQEDDGAVAHISSSHPTFMSLTTPPTDLNNAVLYVLVNTSPNPLSELSPQLLCPFVSIVLTLYWSLNHQSD